MTRYLIPILLLLLIYQACDFNDNKDCRKLKIKNKLGILSDSSYMVSVRQIKIYDNDIYLGDAEANRIIVLDKDMKVKNVIGRSGAGPGEFMWTESFEIINDKIFASSGGRKTINVFDLEGDFLESFQFNLPLIFSLRFAMNLDENFFFSIRDVYNHPIILLNKEGKVVKEIGDWYKYKNAKEKIEKNFNHLIYSSKNQKLYSISLTEPFIKVIKNEKVISTIDLSENSLVKKRLRFAHEDRKAKNNPNINTYNLVQDATLYYNTLWLLIIDYDGNDNSGCNKILIVNWKENERNSQLKCLVLPESSWYDAIGIQEENLIAFSANSSELHIYNISDYNND